MEELVTQAEAKRDELREDGKIANELEAWIALYCQHRNENIPYDDTVKRTNEAFDAMIKKIKEDNK